jgi:hypothetical protein
MGALNSGVDIREFGVRMCVFQREGPERAMLGGAGGAESAFGRGRLELVGRLASLKATLADDLLRRLVFVSGHRLNGGERRAIEY